MDFRSRRGKHAEGKNTTKAVMVKRIYQIPSRHSLDSIHLPFFTYKNISIIKSEVLETGSVKSCASCVLNSIAQNVMEICC